MSLEANLTNPFLSDYPDQIRSAAKRGLPMVRKGCRSEAPGAVSVGCGPSVKEREVQQDLRRLYADGYVFFAIKEAATYLIEDLGIHPHYAVHIDPSPLELQRITVHTGVTYLLASVCHPALYDKILFAGADINVFHSACGVSECTASNGIVYYPAPLDSKEAPAVIELEDKTLLTVEGNEFSPVMYSVTDEPTFYSRLFPCADIMEGGFTAGNRAISLAKYMGISDVYAAGLDFGWRSDTQESGYADFVKNVPHEHTTLSDHGHIDGREWITRVDLLGSACSIAHKVKAGEVTVLGDSMAQSISKLPDEEINQLVRNRAQDNTLHTNLNRNDYRLSPPEMTENYANGT